MTEVLRRNPAPGLHRRSAGAVLSPDVASIRRTPLAPATRRLVATAATCFWGYLDRGQPPVITVSSGDVVEVETLTHHAGDAPDLMMDDGVRAVWDAIPDRRRGPGVHVMTGPIAVRGAEPGDSVLVEITSMTPRCRFGSNCAANWGLLYDRFRKERITIYELGADSAAGGGLGAGAVATPLFGFDFTASRLYDTPGIVSPPDPDARRPFSRPVRVPVRPHLGVMGVAPDTSARLSSIPPGRFGGNVDNWRFGPGAAVLYPVYVEGANLYFGDPHFAQGDGEVCGTAIEASLDVTVRISVVKDLAVRAPVLETDTHWYTHGFGADLDAAMRMSVEEMLWLLVDRLGFCADDAYSLASVAVDLGVTQVVDGTLGCHAGLARAIVA